MNTCQTPPVATSRRHIPLILSLLFICGAYLLLIFYHQQESIKTFSVVFCAIMFEAAPFMLLGSLIGGIIEAFVSRERLNRLIPAGKVLPIFIAAGLGLILPICECAIVPVVRRLCGKGLPPAAAIAYLLGGPAVNPLVAFSTALAYQWDWRLAGLRLLLGYTLAVGISLFLQRLLSGKPILLESLNTPQAHTHSCSCCTHTHSHTQPDTSTNPVQIFARKLYAAIIHASEDFLGAGHYLVIGAFIAALAQTYIDREFFTRFSAYPVLPTLLLIALAVLLNLCSETDAFIAASLRNLLPLSSQLAFMLTGPIFDLKLLLMYQQVFTRRTIIALACTILLSVFTVSSIIEMLERYC